MTRYSIKDVEHLSGVKAHTLRIWEQRHKLFLPCRTDTNIRYYTDEDLKLIICISTLINQGYKIGYIAKMGKMIIYEKMHCIDVQCHSFDTQIKALTTAMIDVDEPHFEKIINISIASNGFEETMLQLVYPFLERIGIMWLTGAINPAQEHFVSNLIRQKIIAAIDKLAINEHLPQKKYVLYLPEREMHEISLLFLAYLLKKRNNRVTYLGANVPLNDLVSVVEHALPAYTCGIFTASPLHDLQAYIQRLSGNLPHVLHIFAGQRLLQIDRPLPDNALFMENIQQMIAFINHHNPIEMISAADVNKAKQAAIA